MQGRRARRSGSRPRRPARSRCWATGRARSRSRATTTPFCSSMTSNLAPLRRTTFDSMELSSGRRLTGVRVPSCTRGTRSGRCGWCSARAGSGRPSRRRRRRRGQRRSRAPGLMLCGSTRSCCSAARPSGPTLSSCSAIRSTPTRCRRRRSSSSGAARHTRAPGRGDRGLRGVHASLPGVVVGPGHPLAALDGADGDDLRRPRRE